ncbi:hypothetical protein JD844_016751 [Phrynosoma platyrhinos]|uniref:RRM domain-containing protein n=1 Tax=Phrynosoma platyrhinos TaxID=52577 RepID=A0ABQ7SKS2_PHRPL|nr:hypothetical protein JD844_016751 [Phrynosoma platyrhinos]
MNKMGFGQNFPQLTTGQQLRKKGSFVSRTRSSLNLPPLVMYQKLATYDKKDDINRVFLKLSALYSNLKDPLKEVLLQCECEDQEKSFKVSYFDMFARNELPQDVYSSPSPDHMPPGKRFFSNKAAKEHTALGVYRQDAPMATIVARWTPKSMSTQYDQKSVLQELAKFGEIESVAPFGRQTVIVVFKEVTSACKAMSAFPPNGPDRSMQCFWHHKFMSKYVTPKFRKTKNSATLVTVSSI